MIGPGGLALLAAVTLFAPAAIAQQYPSKAIRFIVPFPPGGTADIQGRMIADRLGPRLGQQVIIDNRGGANGAIGMEIVARAPADGYTMIISTVGTWTVSPHLSKLPYDVLTDFAPLIHIATTPGVMIVHPSMPVKSVKELIALARQRPTELTFGSAGVGGFGHMCAELFSVLAKVRMTHVPYKGSARTPQSIVDRLNQEINAVRQLPEVQKAAHAEGSTITGGTPAQFHEILKSELAKFAKLIKAAGIKGNVGG